MKQKVRKGEELNEINLKKFLKKNGLISKIKSDLDVLQFSNGFSNLTYQLNIESRIPWVASHSQERWRQVRAVPRSKLVRQHQIASQG